MSSPSSIRFAPFFLGACLSAGCTKPTPAPAPHTESSPTPSAAATSAAVAPPSTPSDPWATPVACADKSCFAFDDDAAAFSALLSKTNPQAIGIGEAHTPAGFTGRTTVRRFTEDLLPVVAPRTSALLVELLAPASGCDGAKQAVKKEADAVTTGQAVGNQDEYTKLGKRARELGAVPDILRASCDDLKAIQSAGELGVVTMMETIARLTSRAVEERRAKLAPDRPIVLAYGGALHNDAEPRAGRESWSYGPELQKTTANGYIELDLVLPALVTDSPTWQSFGWYQALRSLDRASPQSWLIQNGPQSYALVLQSEPAPASK